VPNCRLWHILKWGVVMGKYHLVGIKGTGMSALAICLKQLGNEISGSDVEERFFTSDALDINNIEASLFDNSNITGDKTYIISAAYDYKNVEVNEIMKRKLPYFYYHDFIENYFTGIKIGISGTHGKTTTTLLTTCLLSDFPLSAVIGDGTGIGTTDYKYFVFEACEYKNNFLQFNYDYLVINNIDFDHPDFFDDIEEVKMSFSKVSKKAKYLLINGDDDNTKDITHLNKYTFGFKETNFMRAEVLSKDEIGYKIAIHVDNKKYNYFLPFLGNHMIYNFMASLLVYYLLNKDMNFVQEKLLKFKKPKRRMEEYRFLDNVIIDDYAHHPTEIKACLDGIRLKYPNKKVIVFFEPHTYSRTLALAKEFSVCFDGVDELYLAKTFTSKREKYNALLEKEIIKIFTFAKKFNQNTINKIIDYHDSIIVFMGAGNIRTNISKIISDKT
jgi:UDP-N-acetylmuramate--alanine ligase